MVDFWLGTPFSISPPLPVALVSLTLVNKQRDLFRNGECLRRCDCGWKGDNKQEARGRCNHPIGKNHFFGGKKCYLSTGL